MIMISTCSRAQYRWTLYNSERALMLHHTSGKKTLVHMRECIIAHILSYVLIKLSSPVAPFIVESDSSWQEAAAAVLSQGVLEPGGQVLPQDSCFLILLYH